MKLHLHGPQKCCKCKSTNTDATKTLAAGTAFTTTVDGVDYQFVTTSDRTAVIVVTL